MQSGDGLVLRIRAPGGRLSRDQARGIADLAATCGNGLIDLSARANLQLRGITDHPLALARLTALGLIDADAATEARRNILVTPFWQAGDITPALAEDLAQALATSDLDLPGKFGFAIDTGPTPVLRHASADIRIERGGDTLLLHADGHALAAPVTARTAIPAALDLARWFLDTGGASARRMRNHTAPLPAIFQPASIPTPYAAVPGLPPAGRLIALELGQMRAETLAALAQIAPLRLTPWRMLLLEGSDALPDLPGILTDLADPLLRVVACPGAPACPQGLAPVRELARQMAPHVPSPRRLHVSGCAKGCAHPAPADITLVARADGFAVAHNAKAQAVPADAPSFTLEQALADPALLMTRT